MQTPWLAWALVLGGALGDGSGAGRDAFEEGLAELDELMREQDWPAAHRALLALFETHAEAPYVRVHQFTVEETLQRILFWLEHEPPHPKELVSGTLSSYSPSTGQIRLRYGPDELGDFYDTGSGVLIHPLLFSGNYSLQVKGGEYAPGGVLFAGLSFDGGYLVDFGGEKPSEFSTRPPTPAVIAEISGSLVHVLDANEDAPRHDRRYKLKISVDKSKVKVSHNGKKLVEAEKEPDVWGQVAIGPLPEFDEIEIKGRAQRSWIQNLVDAKNNERWSAFHEDFEVGEHLPEWLRSEVEEVDPVSVYPGERSEAVEEHLRKAFAYVEDGKPLKARRYLAKLDEEEIAPAAREFGLAVLYERAFKYEKAREHCAKVLELEPEYLPARVLDISLCSDLGDQAGARERGVELLVSSPDSPDVYAELAETALFDGKPTEARDWVQQASERFLRSENLDRVHRLLVKAERGPIWDETMVEETEHYRVYSDIDRTTCRDAAKVLERAYKLYEKEFGELDTPREMKFDVYVFSGKASFDRYSDGTLGFAHPMIAGLYSGSLKQLLIWNLPAREDMLSTVRHEGFHQYLDRVTSTAPRWFNEGIAEYVEAAGWSIGRWTLDEFSEAHAATLDGYRMKSLKDFLYIDDGDFLENPGLHYALSYAFVFFLRETTKRRAELFDRYFEELRKGTDGTEAIDLVFKPHLETLQGEFQEFLRDR